MGNHASSRRTKLSAVADPRRAAEVKIRPLAAPILAVPPLALLAAAGALALEGGGIVPEQWAPVAVGTGLALAAVAAVGAVIRIPARAVAALAALGLFVAWSALSMLWSQNPAATVDYVARLGLFAVAMIVGASYASRAGAARALAVGVAAAGLLLALLVEAKVLISTTAVFSGPRLAWPIDYANGAAALLWLPLPALVAASATRRLHPLARGLLAAAAALAAADGLMTLSRGAAIALAGTLIICVLLAPDRPRLALMVVAVLAPVAVLAQQLTAGEPGDFAADARHRAYAAAAAAGIAFVLAGAVAGLDRVFPARFERSARPAAIAICACIVVVGVAAFAVRYGRPDTWMSARWHEFRNLNAVRPGDAGRFQTAASNRYDYWRVALKTARAHPLDGVGAGAFSVPWYRQRAIAESVTDAHSWEFGALAETGVVGFFLLSAMFVLTFIRLARVRRELETFTTAALGGGAAYFVLHASLDWLLRISAVAVPGFLLLGACAAAERTAGLELVPRRQRAVLGLAALSAAVSAVPVYFATTLTARAETQAAMSTARALNTLSLATKLNPWAVDPLVVRSAILVGDGRRAAAVRAAHDATTRGPNDWTTWLALRDAERAVGRRASAAAALARARSLNPRLLIPGAGARG